MDYLHYATRQSNKTKAKWLNSYRIKHGNNNKITNVIKYGTRLRNKNNFENKRNASGTITIPE